MGGGGAGSDSQRGSCSRPSSRCADAISDEFELRFGAFYGTNHEQDADIIPLISFDWQITERDRLTLDRPRTGYGLTHRHDLTDTLALSSFLTFAGESYRLANDGPVPGGAIDAQEFLLGLSLDWKAGPGSLSAFAGTTIGRDYTVLDAGGGTVSESALEDTAFFGLTYQIGR